MAEELLIAGLCAGAALAGFFEARGRRVVDAAGVLWVQHRAPFFMSLPLEARFDLDPGALARALREHRMVGVRYPTRTQPGVPCELFACETSGYSLAAVERRHRAQVRSGLARCEVRAVDPDELLAQGLDLNRQTMERQRRFDPELGDAPRWRRFVRAIRDCPQVSVTGAFVDGRLSAYVVACRDGAWLHLLYKFSRSGDLHHRTNPALDFTVLRAAAADPTLRGVTNGWLYEAYDGDGLRRYKQVMGYRLERYAMRICLHPAVSPALTLRPVVAAAAALSALWPGNGRVQRTAQIVAGARLSRL